MGALFTPYQGDEQILMHVPNYAQQPEDREYKVDESKLSPLDHEWKHSTPRGSDSDVSRVPPLPQNLPNISPTPSSHATPPSLPQNLPNISPTPSSHQNISPTPSVVPPLPRNLPSSLIQSTPRPTTKKRIDSHMGKQLRELLDYNFVVVEKRDGHGVTIQSSFDRLARFVKFTTESTSNDNAFEVQREIYARLTGIRDLHHILLPFEMKTNSDQPLIAMRETNKQNEYKLYSRWILYRLVEIEKQINHTKKWNAKKEESKQFYARNFEYMQQRDPYVPEEDPLQLAEYLLFHDSFWAMKFRKFHYMITPEVQGIPLTTFFQLEEQRPPMILNLIAVQVAQALTVLANKQIMHNNLHFGHILVETYDKPQILSYDFPRQCELRTNYKVTIFDFVRGTAPGLENKVLTKRFCKKLAQCNKYVANFDWYTFLSWVVYIGTEYEIPHTSDFKKILGKYYAQQSPDVPFGLPCKCIKYNQDQTECEDCKVTILSDLMSPEQFFEICYEERLLTPKIAPAK